MNGLLRQSLKSTYKIANYLKQIEKEEQQEKLQLRKRQKAKQAKNFKNRQIEFLENIVRFKYNRTRKLKVQEESEEPK